MPSTSSKLRPHGNRYSTRNKPKPPPEPPSQRVLRGESKAKVTQALRKVTPAPSILHKVPPEIRDALFKLCLIMETKSMPKRSRHRRPVQITPPLLIALRQDPLLYEEALVVFYKVNTFKITKLNYKSLRCHLSKDIFGLVKKLHIEVNSIILPGPNNVNLQRYQNFMAKLYSIASARETILNKLNKVEELSFQWHGMHSKRMVRIVSIFLSIHHTVKILRTKRISHGVPAGLVPIAVQLPKSTRLMNEMIDQEGELVWITENGMKNFPLLHNTRLQTYV